MKTIKIKVLVICIVLSIIFVGCNNKKLTACFVKGENDNSTNSVSANETDLWVTKNREYYTDKKILETVSVEFEGKTYTGKYSYSNVRFLTNYLTDNYVFEGGQFQIDAATGEFTAIAINWPLSKEKKITIEEGEKIAVSIVEKYVDTSEYSLYKYETEYNYQYAFQKMLNGVKTSEKIGVTLTFDGRVYSFAKIMLNAFPKSTEKTAYTERIDMLTNTEALKLVSDTVSQKYPAITEYSAHWSITDKWIVLDENDKMCILYKVEIEDTYDKNTVDEYGGLKMTSQGALDFILIK